MNVRQAGPADVSALVSIANREISDTLTTFRNHPRTNEDIASEIAQKGAARQPFLVGEVAGAVLGFATYAQFRANEGYRHTMEHTIVLLTEAKGRGLGRKLMGGLVEHARAHDVHSLMAGVSAANDVGVEFHRALGFTEVGRLPEVGFKNGLWLDLVVMQLLH